MLHPSPRREGHLSFLFIGLFLPALVKAGPDNFSYSPPCCSHICPGSSLYINNGDAGWLDAGGGASHYVRKEKNNDLRIVIPDVASGKYRLLFYDGQGHLLFRIRQIRDRLLIVEKSNFRHAGHFRYELYKDNVLVEQNTFVIKKDL